jgi:hypothetical protein
VQPRKKGETPVLAEYSGSTAEYSGSTVGYRRVQWNYRGLQREYALQECRFLALEPNPSQGPLVIIAIQLKQQNKRWTGEKFFYMQSTNINISTQVQQNGA